MVHVAPTGSMLKNTTCMEWINRMTIEGTCSHDMLINYKRKW